MTNLTLALDDALLQRAREVALRENTSVNALEREFITHYVDARSRRLEALSRFEAVASPCHSSSTEPWTRESLLTPTCGPTDWLEDVTLKHEVVISTQVLIERRSVATRKLRPPLSDQQISGLLEALCEFEVVSTDSTLVIDALIVEAAIRNRCAVLFSEELSHGSQTELTGRLAWRSPCSLSCMLSRGGCSHGAGSDPPVG